MMSNLSDVLPKYSAVFVFEDPKKGNLQLSMTWGETTEPDEDELQFSTPTIEWARLDRDTGRATELMEMSWMDLQSGFAWQFEILATQAEDASKMPEDFKRFAQNVQFDAVAAKQQPPTKPFVICRFPLPLRTLRQSIKHHYGIVGTDYTLEISQFQDREYQRGGGDAHVKVYEPRWGLGVFYSKWDNTFGQNERLPIGQGAKWDDDMDEWFPAEKHVKEPGFPHLVEQLGKIEELVRSAYDGDDGDD